MELLRKVVHLFAKSLSITNRVANWISMSALVMLMFFVAISVISRYVFNKPILGSDDIVKFCMVVLCSLGFGYAATKGSVIAITILVSRLPTQIQVITRSITYFFSICVTFLIAWQIAAYALQMSRANLLAGILQIPLFPFILIVAFGYTLLCLVLLLEFLRPMIKEEDET